MRRVLVVDDEENLRLVLRTMLRGHGYEVETAASASEALQKIAGFEPTFVLTDVRMDGLSGIELCARLRTEHPEIVAIVMSAYGTVELAIEAMHAGAYDYISKPFKRDEVLLTLRKAAEREELRSQNRALRAQLERNAPRFLGRSEAISEVRRFLERASGSTRTVLIRGESGTGKELVARSLHAASGRQRWVAIACGALPDSTLESELFGHRRGAFSGASEDRVGLFESARGGTLFLDEIGDLTLPVQAKLLRVLQENVVRRLGDTADRRVDARIIASTSQDLEAKVASGGFREDLFYRLDVLTVRLPPLRQIHDDLPLLIEHFLTLHSSRAGTPPPQLSEHVKRALYAYHWPGNVRELENVLERAIVLAEADTIELSDLPEHFENAAAEGIESQPGLDLSELSIKRRVRRLEEELIRGALARTNGNRTAAAKILEISHRALLYKIRDYHIG